MEPSADGVKIFPGAIGATNWYSPSFSPRTGLMYVSTWDDVYGNFVKADQEYSEGNRYVGGAPGTAVPALRGPQFRKPAERIGYGAVRALDPRTGDRKWEFKMGDVTMSGILTTASDLLFTGGREGVFHALDARDGKLLWKINAGGDIAMGPMTYGVSGKQYVAFSAGSSLFVYGLR
jgi:glucose dehydrogenase